MHTQWRIASHLPGPSRQRSYKRLQRAGTRTQAHAPGEGVDTGESVYYYYRAQLDSAN